MPNTREKLIEVLDVIGSCNAEYCADCEFCSDIDGCVRRKKEIIADHLIANGVIISKMETVATDNNVGDKIHKLLVKSDPISEEKMRELLNGPAIFHTGTESIVPIYPYEWIPVSEPPKKSGVYQVYLWDKEMECNKVWYGQFSGYDWFVYDIYGDGIPCDVTHWMSLPEPPKGE